MVLTEQPKYWFYPDVKDNLSQKEDEQLAVEIIRPTGFQSNDFKKIVTRTEFYPDDQPFDKDGNYTAPKKFRSITVDTKFDSALILRTCVGEVRNLSVKDTDGKERKITSGKELAECRAYGIGAIIDAIVVEVSGDKLTDSKKKNIEQDCKSCFRASGRLTGSPNITKSMNAFSGRKMKPAI